MTEAVASASPAVQAGPAVEGAVQSTGNIQQVTPAAPAADGQKMFTVTIDGTERQVTEDELRRGYSHGAAANERMRVANETRQMAEEVLKVFKENPKLAFQKLGVDAKTFAEQVLSEHIEESLLTPEQKELREARKFMKEKADSEAKQKAEAAAAQEAAYREQVSTQLQTDIVSTLGESGLPRNEYTVGRMAYYLDSAIRAGYENVTAKDIIGHVKQEYERDVKALLQSVPENNLLDFLGDDFTKKTVKAHLAKIGPKKAAPVVNPIKGQTQSTAGKKIISPSEFFKRRGRA